MIINAGYLIILLCPSEILIFSLSSLLLSANYLSSETMFLNLFKSKEMSDLIEYNLRIVLCGNAIGGLSCNEI